MTALLVYSTFPNKAEALSVARALLEEKFIACANIYDGITSLYRWEGKIQQEGESVLVAKTTQEKMPLVTELIRQLHSYETPCIVAYPISEGYPPFLKWIEDETT